MNLIIVESPTKARTLSRFLGKEYVPLATGGHIKDLPKSKLSIDVEHDFKPDYVVVPRQKDTIGKIRKEAEKANVNVVVAGHISSDSLGMNIILDELEKKGLEVIPFAGLIRVKRNKKK